MSLESPEAEEKQQGRDEHAGQGESESNWKKAGIATVFGIIEIFSLVLWQKGDEFKGSSGKLIHSISEAGFLAGGAYLANKFWKKPFITWGMYAVLCVILFSTGGRANPKQEIRTFLDSVNPEILKRVDGGDTSIRVMVGNLNAEKLTSLSQEPGFNNFLSFESVGGIAIGHDITIGGFIEDVDENQTRAGFILHPKDALKR